MPSFRIIDDAGAPLTGLTLTFAHYVNRLGIPQGSPTIESLGDGLYSFVPSPANESDGVGYAIDFGAGSNPRRAAGFVGNAHVFFAAYDSAGAFLNGLTPTLTTYKRPSGGAVAPPTISGLGSGLYAFTPTTQDRIDGIRFALDLGVTAWNRYPSGALGEPQAVSSAIVGPSISFAPGADTSLPRFRDIAIDLSTGKFKISNGDLVLTQDRDAIAQAVCLKLRTFKGECFLDIDHGVPYFDRVLVKAPNIEILQQLFRSEIESVPGVKSVTGIKLTFDRASRTLSVVWSADTDLGEIDGSIATLAAA